MASAPAGVACSNITAAGERRRRLAGGAALLAGAIVIAGLALRDAPSMAYAAVFPFAFGAGIGLFQARARTCVALAYRDAAEREGGGLRRLQDAERAQVRQQANRVLLKSFAFAAAITLVAMVLGGLTITP